MPASGLRRSGLPGFCRCCQGRHRWRPSLPPASRGVFEDVCRAVLDWLGFTPEDYRRRFRASQMSAGEQPFTWARQLEDTAASWLRPGPTLAEDQPAGRTAAGTAGGGGGPQSVSCCCLQLRGGEARSAGRREACRIPFWAQFHSLLG